MPRDRLADHFPQFLIIHGCDRVDDADDRGVNRRALLAQRFPGRASFEHDQHFLVHAGADPVHREQRAAARSVVDVQRLHEQQLGPSNFRCF